MTLPRIYPSITHTTQQRWLAEIYLHTRHGEMLICCMPVSCKRSAEYKIAAFIRDLWGALNKLEVQDE